MQFLLSGLAVLLDQWVRQREISGWGFCEHRASWSSLIVSD